jgi:hypothetical protein
VGEEVEKVGVRLTDKAFGFVGLGEIIEYFRAP